MWLLLVIYQISLKIQFFQLYILLFFIEYYYFYNFLSENLEYLEFYRGNMEYLRIFIRDIIIMRIFGLKQNYKFI